jgi:hypothetical protein
VKKNKLEIERETWGVIITSIALLILISIYLTQFGFNFGLAPRGGPTGLSVLPGAGDEAPAEQQGPEDFIKAPVRPLEAGSAPRETENITPLIVTENGTVEPVGSGMYETVERELCKGCVSNLDFNIK